MSRLLQYLGACWLIASALGASAAAQESHRADLVGELFGKPVGAAEFWHQYKTAAYLTRSGKQEQRSEEEVRREAWENLIFLREADRLGITVARSEVEAELTRLLKEKDLKPGGKEYAAWVLANVKEETSVFERRVGDLLRINKLLKSKADVPVTVTEEEMQQKYMNQYNNFESEYICFPTRREAEEFLTRVQQDPSIWKETFDRRQQADGQKGASWINIMSIEALIDLWKIPKEDAYRILEAKEGSFMVAKHYYGEAVFRLLHKQTTSLEEFDDTQRTRYRDLLTTVKKQQAAKTYFDELFARAQLRDYEQERKQQEERRMQAATAETLKGRSSVQLQTMQGDIELKLWPDIAPKACENFITHVERGYYDGPTFHRVIKGFMIQGGDPKGDGTGGESMWGKPFEDEVRADVTFDRPGLLAMANSGPNTNGSQFFITTVPTPWLNGRHTIFGEVTSGFDVVKKISEVPTDASNKPTVPQQILKASVQANAQ